MNENPGKPGAGWIVVSERDPGFLHDLRGLGFFMHHYRYRFQQQGLLKRFMF
jgi:hypothetical protein